LSVLGTIPPSLLVNFEAVLIFTRVHQDFTWYFALCTVEHVPVVVQGHLSPALDLDLDVVAQ